VSSTGLFSGHDKIEHETKYPLCLKCKQRCHGCKICGYVFTCSNCEPCHEGLIEVVLGK